MTSSPLTCTYPNMELSDEQKLGEAEQYHMKALFILHELQANKKVYGSNSALTGATPANVDLALQYIDRSVELFPENTVYLNLKALLLWEGKGDKATATTLLEKAAALNPRDIDIQNNLNAIKTSQCVVATAVFGSPLASEVRSLRSWRDERLMSSRVGKLFVSAYYSVSPPAARFVSRYEWARRFVRAVLGMLVRMIGNRSPAGR
jgi:tetratricopeptide (TPR) repeat protein